MEKDDGKACSLIVEREGNAVNLGLHGLLRSAVFVPPAVCMVKRPFAILRSDVYNSRYSRGMR